MIAIAKKLSMSSIINDNGEFVPVTALKIDDNVVTQIKTKEKDGYVATQVGSIEKKYKSAQKFKYYVEYKGIISNKEKGSVISVKDFNVGDKLKISGISKGKGFAGVMKRWNFHGLPASHGVSISHRSAGSTGMHTFPARTIKGKKMPGHLGCEKVTLKNIELIKIDEEKKILYVKGPIPGAYNSIVIISK